MQTVLGTCAHPNDCEAKPTQPPDPVPQGPSELPTLIARADKLEAFVRSISLSHTPAKSLWLGGMASITPLAN